MVSGRSFNLGGYMVDKIQERLNKKHAKRKRVGITIVISDAFKWTGRPDLKEEPEWIVKAIRKGDVYFACSGTSYCKMRITTPEGVMSANIGDYIIRGVKGEIYPCKPGIFESTYEAV